MCKHAYYELVEVEDFNFSVQTCSVIKVLICKHYKKKKKLQFCFMVRFLRFNPTLYKGMSFTINKIGKNMAWKI